MDKKQFEYLKTQNTFLMDVATLTLLILNGRRDIDINELAAETQKRALGLMEILKNLDKEVQ